MTTIKLKNSTVLNKAPVPGDLEIGELAINANVGSPAAYIKDTDNNIIQIAGAGAGDVPNLEAVLSEGNTATIGMTIADNKISFANDGGASFGTGSIGLNADGSATFTGQVTVPSLPVAATDAASKDYVDSTHPEHYWNRNGTVLSPVNLGDDLAGIGTIEATHYDLESLNPLP